MWYPKILEYNNFDLIFIIYKHLQAIDNNQTIFHLKSYFEDGFCPGEEG